MEGNKLLTLLVTITVGIIFTGALLGPVVNEFSETENTFTNVGRYYVTTEVEDDVTITAVYDIDGTTRQWYIDGDLLVYEPTTTGPEYAQITTVVGTDNWVFRTDGRYRGLTSGTGNADYTLTVTSESVTLGGNSGHAPLIVASVKPTDYVMSNALDTPRYVMGDSELIACGYTTVGVSEAIDDAPAVNTNAVISFTGTVKDGFDITVFDSTYTFTVDNIVVNATAHAGYVDLYDFTSVEFDVISSNDVTTHCTYSVLAVPASVTAEKAHHFDAGEIAILAAIPLMAIAALVLLVVRYFVAGRD